MQYVWRVVNGVEESVLDKYPEIQTVPAYRGLTDRQFKVTALTADIKSPFRTLPEKQRRERAVYAVAWPMEGTRPDKNARNFINGQVESIERAIEEYRLSQYDEDLDTLSSLKTQIHEIKDFLKSDKSIPLVEKGKVVLDSKGKEVRVTDPKTLKVASELGEKLPGLVEAYKKIESILQVKEEKLTIQTYTSNDLPPVQEGEEQLSMLDQVMAAKK